MDTTAITISFITVCMNRKQHLQQTLPKNIADNVRYPNIEFIVLDYGSKDNLESWIESEMGHYIKSGMLKYYKTFAPDRFLRSHSRNSAFRLAAGDILCNVDADNFTGKGFAKYINQHFCEHQNSFLHVDATGLIGRSVDIYGRFCCLKTDFFKVGGFDESFTRYGWEDIDLFNRLKAIGKDECHICNPDFLQIVEHEDIERIANEPLLNDCQAYFIRYVSPSETEVICLLKNGTFERGTLVPSRETNTFYKISIKERAWVTGHWERKVQNAIALKSDGNSELYGFDVARKLLVHSCNNEMLYFQMVADKALLQTVVKKHSTVLNYEKTLANKEKKTINPNDGNFGKALVFKNFDYSRPLVLS